MVSQMRVAKWGNSLAVRIPAAVVDALALKEGDEIDLSAESNRAVVVNRRMTKEELRERVRELRGRIPADFKFDREEAHERK